MDAQTTSARAAMLTVLASVGACALAFPQTDYGVANSISAGGAATTSGASTTSGVVTTSSATVGTSSGGQSSSSSGVTSSGAGGMDGGPDADAAPDGDAGPDSVVQVAGGESSICALKQNGDVYCWGRADDGIVGTGKSVTGTDPFGCSPNLTPHLCQPVPTKIVGLDHIVQIGAQGHDQCALRGTDGAVLCWGNNTYGQLGHVLGTMGDAACPIATDGSCNPTPMPVAGLPAVSRLETGDGWACVLSTAGEVWCWGRNDFGNLGQGTVNVPMGSATPLKVNGLSGVTALSVGDNSHACALVANGAAYCWGSNGSGKLGHMPGTHGDDGSSRNGTATPIFQVDNATPELGLQVIFAQGAATCALRNGGVLCNAQNSLLGPMGVASPALAPANGLPTDIVTLDQSSDVCAVRASGELWCAGTDFYGELGDGNIMTSYVAPHKVASVPAATSVHTNQWQAGYTFIVTTDGQVWGTGSNRFGELGYAPGAEGGTQSYCTACWVRSSFAPVPNLP